MHLTFEKSDLVGDLLEGRNPRDPLDFGNCLDSTA